MTDTQTWTLGPRYPVASCSRCGAEADAKDVASGFCWRCGYLGAVEFKDKFGEITPKDGSWMFDEGADEV